MPSPTMTKSTAGFPGDGVFGGQVSVTQNLISDINKPVASRAGLKSTIWYFGPSGDAAHEIDDGDTFVSGIKQVVAVAFQPEDATDDNVGVALTDVATGTITFKSANAGSSGWLHVLSLG